MSLPSSGNIVASNYLVLLPGDNTTQSLPREPYRLSELPSDDSSTLIDIKGFKFLMNHYPCNNTQPLILILIHSAPGNFVRRKTLRETWAQRSPLVSLLFFIGTSEKFQDRLEDENSKYKDLIQGNFVDVYRNMTYKHVMALKWTTYHCPNAKYILKLDDDVFVHVSAMVEFLTHDLTLLRNQRLILCDVSLSSPVKRTWRSKWRVSYLEYPGRYYPAYCLGWAILYTPDSVLLLYREAQREPYFWIDDIHITGIIAHKLNLTLISLHSLVLTTKKMTDMLSNSRIGGGFLFGPPDMSEDRMRALHSFLSTTRTVINLD
ncbi:beta-1,3-galactosyltransferase 5 isoform X2 [Prorops nasuta]